MAKESDRVSTGIAGLDAKMQGGLVRGSANLVAGKTGTGKTALCVSFLYRGALDGEPGVYVTTEQNEADVKRDINVMFGWDLEALEKKRLLKFISIKPVLPMKRISEDQLAQTTKIYVFDISDRIRQAVKELKAKRVVVDSVSVIEMFIKDEYISKVALMQFIENMKAIGVTSLLSGSVPETSDALSGRGVVEYIVDSIIKLNLIPVTEEFKRTLLIRKMRRTDHSTLVHPFEITKDGLKVIEVKDI
ncbi:MAG: ATPase [Candidatus Aenigmarchaeota archaeon]|nr:ATPase [Candidatus Aenigmarchaeota archaeon]